MSVKPAVGLHRIWFIKPGNSIFCTRGKSQAHLTSVGILINWCKDFLPHFPEEQLRYILGFFTRRNF